MVAPGTVVLVRFPFSDLSQAKLRPALVIADVGYGDYILSQITSNPYADARAIMLREADFSEGSLRVESYVRPGKLFTSSERLIVRQVGVLRRARFEAVVSAIVSLLTNDSD